MYTLIANRPYWKIPHLTDSKDKYILNIRITDCSDRAPNGERSFVNFVTFLQETKEMADKKVGISFNGAEIFDAHEPIGVRIIRLESSSKYLLSRIVNFIETENRKGNYEMEERIWSGGFVDANLYDLEALSEYFRKEVIAISVPTLRDVKKVIFSGNKTIVLWADGTKTIVSCMDGDEFDEYSGFCAALAKKIYGSTTRAKKTMIKANTR